MLAAATGGLIIPAAESVFGIRLIEVLSGILIGAMALYVIEKLFPENAGEGKGAVLFSIAIALHNLPEGIAAGVAYGGVGVEASFGVVLGIALHNLPEGMIAITPLLGAGVGKIRALLIASAGALAEVVGTIIGYYAVGISVGILPFALSFAGGTMLAVITGEMIPEMKEGGGRRATMMLVLGYSVMVTLSSLFG